MKILVINWQDIKNPFGGGAEAHLHEIFSRIASEGNEVHLLCCEVSGLENYEILNGIHIHRHGNRNTFNFKVKKLYLEKFSKMGFDIVIDDINKIPFYTPKFVKEPLLCISHHFFGTSIFRETNIIAGTYVYLAEKMMNRVYRDSKFAVVSQSTLDEFIERGFDKANFTIVPNAIDQSKFPMDVGRKNEEFTICYFGRLKKYKSVDHLFKAFANFNKQVPNSKLNILGKGDFREYLEKLSIDLGIEDKTTFFGFVSEEEKIEQLSLANIVVNTSMKEGWGITNIEANACGTPTLSANVPGLKDSVLEGKSGLLYEYGNIEEITSKLMTLYENDDLRNALSIGAVKWAESFSWDDSARKMMILCEEIISSY